MADWAEESTDKYTIRADEDKIKIENLYNKILYFYFLVLNINERFKKQNFRF